MLYSLHPSHFIRPESKASLMARWTWGLHSWWAAHIKWQPWYLWTDGAARLNSDVCFRCYSRRGDDPWHGEHLRYPSSHDLVLLCHKAALNLQHVVQSGALSCQQAVDHVHISYKFSRPELNCTVCHCDWSHPLPGPDLGPAAFVNRTSISADVSYILFIALGLT